MEKCKLGISTVSMGWHQTHTLEDKIIAAAKYGFVGVEIFITDLRAFAKSKELSTLQAAPLVKELCLSYGLEIICLGSFDNFEGARSALRERLERAQFWVEMAHALGTRIIQIPSNDDQDADGDENVIVEEFKALADLGNRVLPPVSFAYEAVAWGTHVADWEDSLRIVELVDRDNFGLCMDTYHVLSRLWADPRSESGLRAGGRAALNASTKRFLNTCPVEKIMYMQLSDAERCLPPILPGHEAYSAVKDGPHSWCSWGRLFPLEDAEGAYLPVKELSRAWLVSIGFKGWVSLEIFHRKMKEAERDPEYWASRGKASWNKLRAQMANTSAADS